jgi:hypothetical protein
MRSLEIAMSRWTLMSEDDNDLNAGALDLSKQRNPQRAGAGINRNEAVPFSSFLQAQGAIHTTSYIYCGLLWEKSLHDAGHGLLLELQMLGIWKKH